MTFPLDCCRLHFLILRLFIFFLFVRLSSFEVIHYCNNGIYFIGSVIMQDCFIVSSISIVVFYYNNNFYWLILKTWNKKLKVLILYHFISKFLQNRNFSFYLNFLLLKTLKNKAQGVLLWLFMSNFLQNCHASS